MSPVQDPASYTAEEMMTVAAARYLRDGMVCFVGIGRPSTAANLARATHARGVVLVYESGTLGAKPDRLPLSIGDGILAETADAVCSVHEVFSYWLQSGRVDVGFLGAAQIDRFGNINTTIVGGEYSHPKVRLPGAGGAPEIAALSKEVIVIVHQSPRTFVDKVDFVTSVGYGDGPGSRERLGLPLGARHDHPHAATTPLLLQGAPEPPPRFDPIQDGRTCLSRKSSKSATTAERGALSLTPCPRPRSPLPSRTSRTRSRCCGSCSVRGSAWR